MITTAVVRVEGAAKTGEFLMRRGMGKLEEGGVREEEITVEGLLGLAEVRARKQQLLTAAVDIMLCG